MLFEVVDLEGVKDVLNALPQGFEEPGPGPGFSPLRTRRNSSMPVAAIVADQGLAESIGLEPVSADPTWPMQGGD